MGDVWYNERSVVWWEEFGMVEELLIDGRSLV